MYYTFKEEYVYNLKRQKVTDLKMVKKMHFDVEQKVTKVRRNKKVVQSYELAVIQISFEAKRKTHTA